MTTQQDDFKEANAFLGGGSPTQKFPKIGTTVVGTVIDAQLAQQTDIDGSKETWDDGNPKMQVIVTLQTAERDAQIEGDDGTRRVFVKGQMQKAVRTAYTAVGERGILPGGELTIQFYKEEENPKKGYHPTKLFRAKYVAPVNGVGDGDWPVDENDPGPSQSNGGEGVGVDEIPF